MGAPTPTVEEAGSAPVFPTLPEGTELIGEFRGSGYREPPHLVSLPNRQLVHLPTLLFLVVKALHDHRHLADEPDSMAALEQVAAAVSEQAAATLSVDPVIYLVDRKLAPLGVTSYTDGTQPELVKANPFLSLRFRKAVLPERATWVIGNLFGWLFHPVLVALIVAVLLGCEAYLLTTQSLDTALRGTVLTPGNILLVFGLAVASCVFHEFGHAAACRYSGVRPGVMGCGIYIVWPAFYTDITDSYRLGRAGRLRTDLGGVYFNGIFILGLAAAYLLTGFPPLLVAIVSVNYEMSQQLLPTLRFDGYYIVSDLVGIPDLFKYTRPVVYRTLLRRPADERLRALKRWPQVLITIWTLTVIPAIAVQLTIVAIHIPDLAVVDWRMVSALTVAAASGADPFLMFLTGIKIAFLLLPLAGLCLIAYGFVRRFVRFALRKRYTAAETRLG
jgi:putative peptide zinc metalloprotease protein